MHAHVQEYPSRPQLFNLNTVEEHENGAGAKSRVCVLLKTISKCNYIDLLVQVRIARAWIRIHSLI